MGIPAVYQQEYQCEGVSLRANPNDGGADVILERVHDGKPRGRVVLYVGKPAGVELFQPGRRYTVAITPVVTPRNPPGADEDADEDAGAFAAGLDDDPAEPAGGVGDAARGVDGVAITRE